MMSKIYQIKLNTQDDFSTALINNILDSLQMPTRRADISFYSARWDDGWSETNNQRRLQVKANTKGHGIEPVY